MSIDYSACTYEDFDRILKDLVSELTVSELLSYGDVNMFFREEFNNEVLDRWAAEKGISEDEDEDEETA